MTCNKHANVESTAACAHCGKPLCGECAVVLEEGTWCRDCLSAAARSRFGRGKWRSSRLIAGLLSLVPGAGHMYLGLIGKGFAIMGILFLSVFLIVIYADAAGMLWAPAYLIPTLCVLFLSYAVFDSLAIAEAMKSGRDPAKGQDPAMDPIWEKVLLNRRAFGVVTVVAGALGILNVFAAQLNAYVSERLNLGFPVTGLLVPIALLVLGIVLLRKGKTR